MKVLRSTELKFKPVTIILKVETPEDARALYAIFWHSRNCELLSGETADFVRSILGETARVDSGIIANGVSYANFYLDQFVKR